MSLSETLEQLAAFEPAPYPVLSLYLNTQPGPQGRDQHQAIRSEGAQGPQPHYEEIRVVVSGFRRTNSGPPEGGHYMISSRALEALRYPDGAAPTQ